LELTQINYLNQSLINCHYCHLLGHIAYTECKDAACCYRCSVVCLCVCLLVTTVSPTETAEPIEMPFGLWALVPPKKPWPGSPQKGQFCRLSPHQKCIVTARVPKWLCRLYNIQPTDSVWPQQYTGVVRSQIHICIYAKKQRETTNCTNQTNCTNRHK